MIEKGTYRARAREGALGLTSTGKEEVAVAFDLLDVPGTTMTWHGYFTENTFDTTIKALRACGWTGIDLSDLAGIDQNEVFLVVEHETDERDGKVRAKVRWVNGTGGLALKQALAPNEAKSFAARMRGQIIAMDKAAGRAPAAATGRASSRAVPPPGDDDIPF